ncbi:MAG: cell envelope integrity protein TolA [Terrimicrobiaceae bacterium]
MSASIPEKRTERTVSEQLTRLTPREWLLSALLHLVIFGMLIWLLPVKEIVTAVADRASEEADRKVETPDSREPPQVSLAKDSSRVRQVVDEIERVQSDNAADTVADLFRSERALDELARESVDQLNQVARQMAPDAPQKALEQLRDIPEKQAAAAQEQDKLTGQINALAAKANEALQTDDPAQIKAVADSSAPIQGAIRQLQENIRKNQVETEESQTKVAQQLNFSGEKYAAPSRLQQTANATQNAASDTQEKGALLQNQAIATLNGWAAQTERAKQLADQIGKLKLDLDQLAATIPADKQAFDAAEAARIAAHHASYAAQAKAAKTKDAADQQAAVAAKQASEQANAAQAAAHKKLAQDNAAKGSKEWSYNFLENDLRAKAVAAAAAAKAALPGLIQQSVAAHKAAQDQQAAAKQQQQAASGKLAEVSQRGAGAESAATQYRVPVLQQPVPDARSLEGKDLAELYREALAAERRIAEKYRTFRAAQLATIRKMSLEEALNQTQVAAPGHEKLDAGLLAARGADQNLAAYKNEVLKANQQLGAMSTLGENMVMSAQAQKELAQGAITVAALPGGQDNDAFQKMEADATADAFLAGKDLSGLMKAAADAKGRGEGQGADPGETGLPGGGSGGPAQSHDNTRVPFDLSGHAVRGLPRDAPELPAMDFVKSPKYGTRRILKDGPHHADWLYLDSWYFIGPFPNAGRRNINTKFPPETVVDLNGVYAGKNDAPVRWRFRQWDTPRIIPEHSGEEAPAIYYAYTELFLDEPRDLWVASGSDDKGTMWVNDIMVWKSGDQLKNWIPNEGYRKVHFVKGYNRILYRLENGQFGAVFSVMISTRQG